MAEQPRSLAAALQLPPEAHDFIHGAQTKPTSRAKPSKTTADSSGSPTANSPESKKSPRRERSKPRGVRREQAASRAKIAITTRFTEATADALRRESLQRKLRNEAVHTQQDIIELAVSSWLAKAASPSTDE